MQVPSPPDPITLEPVTLEIIAAQADAVGLVLRGAFNPAPGDEVPPLSDGRATATLALLGWVGGSRWPIFADSPEAADGLADPLDRWSRRVVGGIADALGATAFFPFGNPPRINFQKCGRKVEPVHTSPVGVLIHPDHGLWHSYRGALAFAGFIDCPAPEVRASPCATCVAKPCLSGCPVAAFTPGHYDLAACSAYLDSPGGDDCVTYNCAARRSCPVGADYRYSPAQSQFHMGNFRRSVARHVAGGLTETNTGWPPIR